MIQRLRVLKHYFSILVEDGVLDPETNLTKTEWDILEEIEEVLEPFMLVQRVLEGQKYVTLSFVAYVTNTIRKNVHEMILKSRSDEVKELCREMLEHSLNGMSTYWGSGEKDTCFDENNSLGRGMRQKGIPHNTLLAQVLDPRSKSLRGIGSTDKNKIWDEIRMRLRKLYEAKFPVMRDVNEVNDEEIAVPVKSAISELFRRIGEDSDDECADEREKLGNNVEDIINVEIDYYKGLKNMDLTEERKNDDKQETFLNPLIWWKIHSKMLPLLSTLASRILCIPATSAPSERVFSSAGLTIAKCRASLQPQHASELIFLHDSWPFAEKCENNRIKSKF